jgi:hypothetical protein
MRPLFSEVLLQKDKCANHKSGSCKSSWQQQQHHQIVFFIIEMMKQNSSEEGKWEANRLNCKMESTLNNTLQLKYEKQLNVKTSKETI